MSDADAVSDEMRGAVRRAVTETYDQGERNAEMLVAAGMEAAGPLLQTEDEFDALMDEIKSKLPDSVVANSDDEVSSGSSDVADVLAGLCDPTSSEDEAGAAQVAEASSSSGSTSSTPQQGSEAAEVADEVGAGSNPAKPEALNTTELPHEPGVPSDVVGRALLCCTRKAAPGYGFHVGGNYVDDKVPDLFHIGLIKRLTKKAVKAKAAEHLGIHIACVELGTISDDGKITPIPPGVPLTLKEGPDGLSVAWILAAPKGTMAITQ